jgi:hypothetical protein
MPPWRGIMTQLSAVSHQPSARSQLSISQLQPSGFKPSASSISFTSLLVLGIPRATSFARFRGIHQLLRPITSARRQSRPQRSAQLKALIVAVWPKPEELIAADDQELMAGCPLRMKAGG